jgi:hypothetical protein
MVPRAVGEQKGVACYGSDVGAAKEREMYQNRRDAAL